MLNPVYTPIAPSITTAAATNIKLPVGYYQFIFEALEPLEFETYPGSTWRGALGYALKHLVCIEKKRTQCKGCPYISNCAYGSLYEKSIPWYSKKMQTYTQPPHPYIISPWPIKYLNKGETCAVDLILIGQANSALPYLITAFREAGLKGLTKNKNRLLLKEVLQETVFGETVSLYNDHSEQREPLPPQTPDIPTLEDYICLEFESPVSIKHKGELLRNHLTFEALFSALMRRLSMLSYFYTDSLFETDFKELIRQAKAISLLDTHLHQQKHQRYSTKQRQWISLEGQAGRFFLDGKQLEPFWPYLWLGQWTHIGKGAVMGQGKYRIIQSTNLTELLNLLT